MLGFEALGVKALGEASTVSISGVLPIEGEVRTFVLTGHDALFHRTVLSEAGSFSFAGQDASRSVTFRAQTGVFTLGAPTTGVHRGYRLFASPTIETVGSHNLFQALGRFALGGGTTGATQATTFVFTGNNADFDRVASFSAETGVFTFTGVDASFTLEAYPTNIRIFPRVGRGIRTFATGRTADSTGPLVWNGDILFWNGDQLVWNGQAKSGGVIIRTSVGRGLRARAFGG